MRPHSPCTLGGIAVRENAFASIGPVIGMIFAPVGILIGALAMFLVMGPLTGIAPPGRRPGDLRSRERAGPVRDRRP